MAEFTPRGAWPRRLAFLVLLGALGYLVVLPLIRLQALALSDGAQGYRDAFTARNIGRTIRYTVGLALGSLAIAMVLGTLLAWAATRLPPRLRFLRLLPILPIVLPAVATVIGWAFLFSPAPGYINALLRNLPWWRGDFQGPVDVYTLPWIVILTGFGLTAFVYLFVSAGMQNINSELLEAAQVAGSRPWKVFFKVTLPLLRPTLLYGGGVALLLGLGQFTGPLLLGRNRGINVLTTEMYLKVQEVPVQYGTAAALGSPLLITGITVVLLQKWLLGDQKRFVTHGGKAFKSQGRPSKLAALAMILYSFAATVLPVGSLFIVALSKFWSSKIDVAKWSLQSFRTVFETDGLKEGIYNSVTLSLTAVAITMPLGFVAASLILRSRRFRVMRSLLDLIVALPLGVPAVIFGIGFLYTYTRAPFVLYGTRWVMILVYVTLMIPFATRMQLSGMVALGEGYLEAARVSGAGALRTNLRILLPLMRPALSGAAALMFVLLTHEFSASLLVRASTMDVMGTTVFDAWSNGNYPVVAALALVMGAVTLIGVALAMLVGGSDALTRL